MATTSEIPKIKSNKLKDVFVMKPKEFNMQFMTEKTSEKTFSSVSPSKHAQIPSKFPHLY
jgi:hypothetical protein